MCHDDEEPRDPLEVLDKQVTTLRDAWTMWRRLFYRDQILDGDDPRRTVKAEKRAYDLTGRTSELVFRHVRWSILRGVVMDICRLCDKRKTMGHDNFTLERVADEVPFEHQGWNDRLRGIAANARNAAEEHGLFDLRNRILAHLDLQAALGEWEPQDFDVDGVDLAVRWIIQFHHQARNPGTHNIHPARDQEAPPEVLAQADRLLDILEAGLQKTE